LALNADSQDHSLNGCLVSFVHSMHSDSFSSPFILHFPQTCKNYTRAYLYSVVTHEAIGCHLITLHNMHYMKRLMSSLRQSIIDGNFPEFVQDFLDKQFPGGRGVPQWVCFFIHNSTQHLVCVFEGRET
jgi:hypothetical protein